MTSCAVIIPTRDRPEGLRRAVTSALKTAPPDASVIVVDDGGEIPAAQSLETFADARLRVTRNPGPGGGGGSPARNHGVTQTGADVLFFLDDDDQLLPDYVAMVLGALRGPAAGAGYGFAPRRFKEPPRTETRPLTGLVTARTPFDHRAFPFSAGFWIRRSLYDRIGPFATDLQTNSDTEYVCRLQAVQAKGWCAPTPGTLIGTSPTSGAELAHVTRRTKSDRRAEAFKAIINRYPQLVSGDSSTARFLWSRYIKHACRAGQPPRVADICRTVPPDLTRMLLVVALWLRSALGRRA